MVNPEHSATLTFKTAVRKDTQIYKITVENEYGKDTAEIDVLVLGKTDVTWKFTCVLLCIVLWINQT